jgi:hypothetical protein
LRTIEFVTLRKRERGKRERGKEGKRERGKEGKRERGIARRVRV